MIRGTQFGASATPPGPIGFPSAEHVTRAMMAGLPIAVCIHDTSGVIVDHNERAARLWGRPPVRGDRTGRNVGFRQLYRLDGFPVPDAVSPVALVLETGQAVVGVEVLAERPDGALRSILISVLPLSERGIISGAISCFRDAPQLQPESTEGLVGWETLARLSGNLAHDLANLFLSVRLNVDLAERRTSDPALQKPLSGVERAAERGLVLARQLMAYAGKLHLSVGAVDLNTLLTSLRSELAMQSGPGIRLDLELAPGLWAARADHEQLEMVIRNLVTNAREAMGEGGSISISTANVRLTEEPGVRASGDYVAVTIADTGSGMDRNVLTQAFEPYFSTKSAGESKGLGLSTTLGILRQMGGDIRLESRIGFGTTVTFHVPRAVAKPVAEPIPEISMSENEEGEEDEVCGGTVLVVDDDSIVRAAAVDTLESFGFTVLFAANGVDALDLLRNGPEIDLLLADFQMLPMDGAELIRQSRAVRPDLRAILITGIGELPPTIDADFAAVLRKPLRAVDLIRQVRHTLEDVRKLAV